MRYVCLACDFDGTLASAGVVPADVIQSLARVKASGRNLILVTGRRLEDLFRIFPDLGMFDYVVSENGGLLYRPTSRVARLLTEPPPLAFTDALKVKGVTSLELGRVIVAAWHPSETKIVEAIQELGLDLHISFNKGAVMVLPSGVDKGTGVCSALSELGLSKHNLVGVGDAENDHALLSKCECSVAVANAIPRLKEHADFTVSREHGAGVIELIDRLLANDLKDSDQLIKRHDIELGTRCDDSNQVVTFKPYDYRVLIAGPSQSGKSTVSMAMLEKFASAGYQYCVIDPEGDYDRAPRSVSVGNEHYAPNVEDILRVLENPDDNVVVNLLGVRLNERASFLATVFAAIQNMRRLNGRPHWLVIDEAHHMLHPFWDRTVESIWHEPGAVVLATVDPAEIAQIVLAGIDLAIAVGPNSLQTLGTFGALVNQKLPHTDNVSIGWGELLAWFRREDDAILRVQLASAPAERQRHMRKYADGDLGPHRSFYFTGPDGRMNIKCQNLFLFMQIGEGVDDNTWLFHLRRGDYSAWFKHVIRDQVLAREACKIEQDYSLSATDSRNCIRLLIEQSYTLPVKLFG